MKFYIRDEQGYYYPATTQDIIKEGRNYTSSLLLDRGKEFICSSAEAKEAIASKFQSQEREVFGCLFLDGRNRVLAWTELFFGTIHSTTVHPREVVKEALRLNAASIIFAHNHPSGDSNPSSQDIDLTKKLKEILAVIDVLVLDHLIVGETTVSLQDRGMI